MLDKIKAVLAHEIGFPVWFIIGMVLISLPNVIAGLIWWVSGICKLLGGA